MKTFISGSEAIGFAAIKGGVRFFAGYPITPASGIYSYMMDNLRKGGGVAVGASDEISAISYAIGASMKGLKAMTATSGPGFSLMVESLSYAIMTETPLLIVLSQRMGPATGAATQSAQGDLLFTAFSNSGAYPIPIFSPAGIRDSFRVCIHAINVSEELRTPVILLTEKEITMTYESVDLEKVRFPKPAERRYYQGSPEEFKTYFFEKPEDIPPFAPLGSRYIVRATGSAHDKSGFLKKDDPEVFEILRHLNDKIIKNTEDINLYDYHQEGSDSLLITYGVTSKSALEAKEILMGNGRSLDLLIMKLVFPLPDAFLEDLLQRYKKVFIAEENLTGQLADLIKITFGRGGEIIKINKTGGLISPSEIVKAMDDYE